MLQDSEQIWLEKRLMERQVWKSKAKKTVQQERKYLVFFFSPINSLFSSYTEVNVCHSGGMVMVVDMRNGWECLKELSLCSTLTGFSPCQWWLFLLKLLELLLCSFLRLGEGEEWQLGRDGISWSRCRSGRWCGGRRMLAGWSLWLTVAGQWAHLHQPLFNQKRT